MVLNYILVGCPWGNSRHFATPQLVSPRNDFWGTSGEISRWWCVTIWVHRKLQRSVSDLQCQFSPTGQCPIQPLLEPFEHNFGQNSSIKRVLQPTLGPISALGSDCILLTERAPFLGLKQTFWFTMYYLGSASDWMKQIFNQSEALYNQYGIFPLVPQKSIFG